MTGTPYDATIERQLLREADYVYDADAWEATHNDFGTLADEGNLNGQVAGEITTVGRLKALPNVYAVNVPVAWDDSGEPEDWEVQVYETTEAARAGYAAACAQSRHSPDASAAKSA